MMQHVRVYVSVLFCWQYLNWKWVRRNITWERHVSLITRNSNSIHRYHQLDYSFENVYFHHENFFHITIKWSNKTQNIDDCGTLQLNSFRRRASRSDF